MRIGVISDTHGRAALARKALRAMGPVDLLVHLGDGEGDLEPGPTRLIQIKGNCDVLRDLPREVVEPLAMGRKALFCHGDEWGVKWGLMRLALRAQEAEASLACFGHTHRPCVEQAGGVLLVNPGHCKGWGATCAVIELENGILKPKIISLDA